MGLEFCYEFRVAADCAGARRLVVALRDEALRQSFDTVHDLWEIGAADGSSIGAAITPEQESLERRVAVWYEEYPAKDGETLNVRVPAIHVLRFVAHTEGAETAVFGLVSHPAFCTHTHEGGTVEIATQLGGIYTWHSCCKTQYAALPQRGGIPNFLRAHYALVNMCDVAQGLGMDVTVRDGGGFWQHRDEKKLIEKLEEWNELVAVICGPIGDALRDQTGVASVAPITNRPDFEHLEARGRRRLAAKHAERTPEPPAIG